MSRRPAQDKSTHTLVPAPLVRRLRRLSERSRVSQADLLREALSDVLAKHADRDAPTPDDYANDHKGELVSVVFRVDPRDLAALSDLSRRTRVRVSEYMREGIADVVTKHGGWLVSAGVKQ